MPSIDAGVRIGHVHLKVSDLERSLKFYRDVLGFEVMQRMGAQAAFLSAGVILPLYFSSLLLFGDCAQPWSTPQEKTARVNSKPIKIKNLRLFMLSFLSCLFGVMLLVLFLTVPLSRPLIPPLDHLLSS